MSPSYVYAFSFLIRHHRLEYSFDFLYHAHTVLMISHSDDPESNIIALSMLLTALFLVLVYESHASKPRQPLDINVAWKWLVTVAVCLSEQVLVQSI